MKRVFLISFIIITLTAVGVLAIRSRNSGKPVKLSDSTPAFSERFNNDIYYFNSDTSSLEKLDAGSGKTSILVDGIDLNVDNAVWSPDKSKVILSFYNDHGSQFVDLKQTPLSSLGNVIVDLGTKTPREFYPEARQIKWLDNNSVVYKVVDDELGGAVLYSSSVYGIGEPNILGSISEEDEYLPAGNKIFVAHISTDVSDVSIRAIDRSDNLVRRVGTYKNYKEMEAVGKIMLVKYEHYDFVDSETLKLKNRFDTQDLLAVGDGKVYLLSQTGELNQYLIDTNQKVLVKKFENLPTAVSFSIENSIIILDTGNGLVKLKI